MTPARLTPPTARRPTDVVRTVAGFRPPAVRLTSRPIRITPPLRAPEPPSGPSNREIWKRWEELEWFSCTYCDAQFGPKVVAEVDHVVPLAKGGLHNWSNLAPACRACNKAKSDLDMSDWLAITAGHRDTESDLPVTLSPDIGVMDAPTSPSHHGRITLK